jgi:hypothetical protein
MLWNKLVTRWGSMSDVAAAAEVVNAGQGITGHVSLLF